MGGSLLSSRRLALRVIWLLRGNGNLVENALKDRLRIGANLCAASRDQKAMGKDARHEALDVIRDRVSTTVHKRESLNASEERDRAARADTQFDLRVLPRRVDDLQHVVDDGFIDMHFPAVFLQRHDV